MFNTKIHTRNKLIKKKNDYIIYKLYMTGELIIIGIGVTICVLLYYDKIIISRETTNKIYIDSMSSYNLIRYSLETNQPDLLIHLNGRNDFSVDDFIYHRIDCKYKFKIIPDIFLENPQLFSKYISDNDAETIIKQTQITKICSDFILAKILYEKIDDLILSYDPDLFNGNVRFYIWLIQNNKTEIINHFEKDLKNYPILHSYVYNTKFEYDESIWIIVHNEYEKLIDHIKDNWINSELMNYSLLVHKRIDVFLDIDDVRQWFLKSIKNYLLIRPEGILCNESIYSYIKQEVFLNDDDIAKKFLEEHIISINDYETITKKNYTNLIKKFKKTKRVN